MRYKGKSVTIKDVTTKEQEFVFHKIDSDISEAEKMVENGSSPAAFILNPTKVSQIRAVAEEGGKMPQKSTYFYPKLIAGLTVNQFKEV